MDSLNSAWKSRKERQEKFRENPYDPIECGLTCNELHFVTFSSDLTVGQLIDWIFFLRLSVVQTTCTEAKTLEMVNFWINYLVRMVRRRYPCFTNVDFEFDPVAYFDAVQTTNKDMIEVCDLLLSKARSVHVQGSGI